MFRCVSAAMTRVLRLVGEAHAHHVQGVPAHTLTHPHGATSKSIINSGHSSSLLTELSSSLPRDYFQGLPKSLKNNRKRASPFGAMQGLNWLGSCSTVVGFSRWSALRGRCGEPRENTNRLMRSAPGFIRQPSCVGEVLLACRVQPPLGRLR